MSIRTSVALSLWVATGCGGETSSTVGPGLRAAMYEAVYERVSSDRDSRPLVHPSAILVDDSGVSYPGHEAAHYGASESIREVLSGSDVEFCQASGSGPCDGRGRWVAFSVLRQTPEGGRVSVTFVEPRPDGTSRWYYRSDVTSAGGDHRATLQLLGTEN